MSSSFPTPMTASMSTTMSTHAQRQPASCVVYLSLFFSVARVFAMLSDIPLRSIPLHLHLDAKDTNSCSRHTASNCLSACLSCPVPSVYVCSITFVWLCMFICFFDFVRLCLALFVWHPPVHRSWVGLLCAKDVGMLCVWWQLKRSLVCLLAG